MDQTATIERLKELIAKPTISPTAKKIAQKQLDALLQSSSGGASAPTSTSNIVVPKSVTDPDVRAILEALQKVLASGMGGGGVNQAQLRQAVIDELSKHKIDLSDLSDSLKNIIQSSRAVSITVNHSPIGTSSSKTMGPAASAFLKKPDTQKVLSDALAKNNIYLYGPAGSGKTFMAEMVADMLEYDLITLTCNQYTSPLDILGGQTIDGYQEGKLSMAWSNTIYASDGTSKKVKGCVLLLDELPKIDPNTAGLLNDALAKVKNFKHDTSGALIPPTIMNGRNEKLPLGNLIVLATGNVKLNEIDPDYEANFKQDLSLQDRFIGSTYEVGYDVKNESEVFMKGFVWIWNFCQQLRMAIISVPGASGQAFVSMRLMQNMRETYMAYRQVKAEQASGTTTMIHNPKTILESVGAFLSVFKPATRQQILNKIDIDKFATITDKKNAMPWNPDSGSISFDTEEDIKAAEKLVADYEVAKSKSAP